VLYPAVSNWAAWQIAKALGISAREGLARFEVIQPMYNLAKRQAEVEILPLAASEGVGVIPYSPLGGGLLVGRYLGRGAEQAGRLVENAMYAKRYARELESDVAERFVAYAAEHGVHPATLAVAWVGSHPAVTAPIVGARNAEQLAPSLAAAAFTMTPAMRAEIAALTPPVPLAHDRAEEAEG
jgi:aryl-alcohol dehydrogenase-like predicted oxidoreductase